MLHYAAALGAPAAVRVLCAHEAAATGRTDAATSPAGCSSSAADSINSSSNNCDSATEGSSSSSDSAAPQDGALLSPLALAAAAGHTAAVRALLAERPSRATALALSENAVEAAAAAATRSRAVAAAADGAAVSGFADVAAFLRAWRPGVLLADASE